MKTTDKQREYVTHRAAGMAPTAAARAAGYAPASAKVTACRLEARDDVQTAIAESKRAAPARTYGDAEAYLLAVVSGAETPDPVRVSAARALIRFQAAPKRRPLPAVLTPKREAALGESDEQRALDADWDRVQRELE